VLPFVFSSLNTFDVNSTCHPYKIELGINAPPIDYLLLIIFRTSKLAKGAFGCHVLACLSS
jgi:hypothetical protein